jgi:hypothetical protein
MNKKKYITLIIFLIVSHGMLAANQDSLKSRIPISIKAGYKAPSEGNYHSTNSGFGLSLSARFLFSNRFSIHPSFVLWTSKYKFINPCHENITLKSISALIGYQFDINEFTIEPKLGLGLSKASDTHKQLFTSFLGVGLNYNYDVDIQIQLDILQQNAFVFDVGGSGPSFDNILLLFGFEFTL